MEDCAVQATDVPSFFGNFVVLKLQYMNYEKEWGIISKNIRNLLEQNGWSISAFADTYNIDRANLSRIVSGSQTDTKYSTLFKIANAFGIKVGDLMK